MRSLGKFILRRIHVINAMWRVLSQHALQSALSMSEDDDYLRSAIANYIYGKPKEVVLLVAGFEA